MIELGGPAAYAPGRTPWTASTSSPAPTRHQPDLTRGETRGPEVEDPLLPGLVAHRRVLVEHPGAGSNSSPSSSQRTANPAENALTATPRRAVPPRPMRLDDPVVVIAAEQPETALAEADRSVVLPVDLEIADVEHLERRRSPRLERPLAASATKSGERSTPCTVIPRRASASEWRPGRTRRRAPASPARTRARRRETDLVQRPLRERVLQYAGPRNAAISLNHGPSGAFEVGIRAGYGSVRESHPVVAARSRRPGALR